MSKLIGRLRAEGEIRGKLSAEPSFVATMVSGARGKSAYEIWLDDGNIGSEQDFLRSLKAEVADYEKLRNKPSIGGVELEGDKAFEELGIVSIEEGEIKKLF